MKDELRNEERNVHSFTESAYKQLLEKFRTNHEKIKREILELLETAFKENERYIAEEVRKRGSSQPIEFAEVQRRITDIDTDIDRLLSGLRGTRWLI
jgi:superfamily I DNA and RNA helicase